jgi:acyl-CoA thioesterase
VTRKEEKEMEEGKAGEGGRSLTGLKERLEDDPFARHLGIRVLELGEGFAKLEMEIGPQMSNFMGSIHGGAIFALADHAFAAASNSHGIPAVALHLDITYFSVPPPGSTLIAEARELHLSRRTGTYLIEISSGEGIRIASCQGIVHRKSKENGAYHERAKEE